MRIKNLAYTLTIVMLPALANAQSAPKTFDLKASPPTVHRGFFDASLKPVLTIDSGDIVRLETVSGNPRWFEKLGVPKDKIPSELPEQFPYDYLPVHVAGALLSVGDGHAVQGHGEVSLSAVETSLKGEIQVVLHKNRRLRWPRAETATHYITMGLDPDLDQAAKIATSEMLDLLVETRGLSRDEVYLLASAAMDLIVTQVVDGTKGVHAMMPKAIFQK